MWKTWKTKIMQCTAALGAFALCAPVFAASVLASSILVTPSQAFGAEDAFITNALSETAQVQTTGTLHVVEQRALSFTQPTDVLRWDFTGLPSESDVDVAAVRIAEVDAEGNLTGDWRVLPQTSATSDWRTAIADSGANLNKARAAATDNAEAVVFPSEPAWALDKWKRTLYVFFDLTTQPLMVEVDWSATNAVAAYDDVAEMYWDYTPTRGDMDTLNVSATVQLPVPEGTQVIPGETVLAWGHGAPGQVDVTADGSITYMVPQVTAGQYAQAHILFPAAWLTNLSLEARQAYSGTRLDFAKAEEDVWTDTYSNQRVNEFLLEIIVVATCAAILAAAIVLYVVYGRERQGEVPQLPAADLQRLQSDAPLMRRFTAWNHISPEEPDPDALTRRIADEGLFDPRSFKLQKGLFVVAVVLIGAAVVALFAFGTWLNAIMLVVTGISVGVIANYMPRRTPKGMALAAACEGEL